MKNLLKSDFYRLFKSLSFYICLGVAVFLFCLGAIMEYMVTKLAVAKSGGSEFFPYKNGISYGITAFMSSNILMIIAIFTGIFIVAEFSHGTMKNLVSKGFSKLHIYLSKMVTMTAASFLFFLATFIAGTLTVTIITGSFGSFAGTLGLTMLKVIGIELLLNIAFIAVLIMIAMVVRNLGGVIAIDIIGLMSLESYLFAAVEFFMKSKIEFSKFSLMYNISYYSKLTPVGSDFLRSFIVAIVFFAVMTVFGVYMFQKSDVK